MKGTTRSEVWCFACDKYKVTVGKKCKQCGARCYKRPDRKYKQILARIKNHELSDLEWDSVL
jgi:hypothetical protein